jgi:NAD+ kinase
MTAERKSAERKSAERKSTERRSTERRSKQGRVLVVYKKSPYQLYVKERGDEAYQRAIAEDAATARRLIEGHERQQRAFHAVEQTLARRGVAYTSRWRGKKRSTRGYSLVIAVGGDGTLLDTAQYLVEGTPLLGINSDPTQSVGKLCAATATELDQLLEAIDDGALRPKPHTRLRVHIDDEQVLGPCLNDVLFAHRSPADMSRFSIGVIDDEQLLQLQEVRSSGIWISTATGSTAAIRSAGGKVMRSGSRRLQYVVREPYSPPDEPPAQRREGFLTPGQTLRLISRMDRGFVWGDGPHRRAAVRYGQTVSVDADPCPLQIYRARQ